MIYSVRSLARFVLANENITFTMPSHPYIKDSRYNMFTEAQIKFHIFKTRLNHKKTMKGHNTNKRITSHIALEKLIADYQFETVLDIGCGAGEHAEILLNSGKKVTALDYGKSVYFNDNTSLDAKIGDFNVVEFEQQFDCIWSSHVLEHQLNPQTFLLKTHRDLKEGGVLCLSVPPTRSKNWIVGGHVSFWNAGLLLYRLVLAGFDCKNAKVLQYGYNISVIVEKKSIDVIDQITYDAGDIKTISPYLPSNLPFKTTKVDTPFLGNLTHINWYQYIVF